MQGWFSKLNSHPFAPAVGRGNCFLSSKPLGKFLPPQGIFPGSSFFSPPQCPLKFALCGSREQQKSAQGHERRNPFHLASCSACVDSMFMIAQNWIPLLMCTFSQTHICGGFTLYSLMLPDKIYVAQLVCINRWNVLLKRWIRLKLGSFLCRCFSSCLSHCSHQSNIWVIGFIPRLSAESEGRSRLAFIFSWNMFVLNQRLRLWNALQDCFEASDFFSNWALVSLI